MPLVGIIRGIPAEAIEAMVPHYVAAGLTTLEITLNTPDALAIISSLTAAWGGKLNIGAGSVCTLEDLDQAVAAGAGFIVSPITDPSLIRACVQQKLPVFPGAYSPTEVYQAWQSGATMVKLFPASLGGPEYVKALKGPLPLVPLLPTGGVSLDNLAAFVQAGAAGFGLGGGLFPRPLWEGKQGEALERHFRTFADAYRQARAERT